MPRASSPSLFLEKLLAAKECLPRWLPASPTAKTARPHKSRTERTAILKIVHVTLVLTEQPWGFSRLHQFKEAGIDPLDYKIVVMQVGYLHSQVMDIAPRGFMVVTSDLTPLDLNTLAWSKVIRPIFPLGDDFG